MKPVWLVVPGSLATRTGGSIYDRRIAEGLAARGWDLSVIELDPFVSPLSPPLDTAGARFSAIPDQSVVLVDGLAFGTMPEIVEAEARRLRFVPIVHMALSTTPGLSPGEAAWLRNMERRALVHTHHVVTTGLRTTSLLRTLSGFGSGHVTRIPPGTDRVDHRRDRMAAAAPLRLLCVANLTPGKGYDILLQALAASTDVPWMLACAGSAARSPETAARLRAMADELGLASRIEWLGELDEATLAQQYERADLFVLASRSETYGMALAEAIAHGLPVIGTRTGEAASIAGDGALLAEPGSVPGFVTVLAQVLSDAELRARLAEGAREAALRLPSWEQAADGVDRVLEMVAARG